MKKSQEDSSAKKSAQKKPSLHNAYVEEDVSKTDRYAYHLIKLFAGAIQGLNDGALPLPTHWKDFLNDTLKANSRGAPPDPEINSRNIEMAKKKLLHQIEIDAGKTTVPMKNFISDLEVTFDVENAHRAIKGHKGDAMASILSDRIDERQKKEFDQKVENARKINKQIEDGKSLDDILYDPKTPSDEFSAVWGHKNNGVPLEGFPPPATLSPKEKAIAWISDGMNRHIQSPESYQTFIDPDPDVLNAAFRRKK